jgi:hypothetical protein
MSFNVMLKKGGDLDGAQKCVTDAGGVIGSVWVRFLRLCNFTYSSSLIS